MPADADVTEMMKFNEELVDAGVMLAGDGLQATSKGSRVEFTGDKVVVTDGPFPESKELLGGLWMWKVNSKEEALDWAKRCPMQPGDVLELRQVFEPEDFGPDVATRNTPCSNASGKTPGSEDFLSAR
jgi:hypothetical protein